MHFHEISSELVKLEVLNLPNEFRVKTSWMHVLISLYFRITFYVLE